MPPTAHCRSKIYRPVPSSRNAETNRYAPFHFGYLCREQRPMRFPPCERPLWSKMKQPEDKHRFHSNVPCLAPDDRETFCRIWHKRQQYLLASLCGLEWRPLRETTMV